jgi:hypothetical protein
MRWVTRRREGINVFISSCSLIPAFAVITACVALAALTTGPPGATSTGYKACANASQKLALENSSGNSPANFSNVCIGAQGPKGPAGPKSQPPGLPGPPRRPADRAHRAEGSHWA